MRHLKKLYLLLLAAGWLGCVTTGPIKSDEQAQPKVQKAPPPALAEFLPDGTFLYGRMDLGQALDETHAFLNFIDPELTRRLAEQATRAHSALVRMAANHGFKARLFEWTPRAVAHLVVLSDPGSALGSPGAGAPQGQKAQPKASMRLLGDKQVVSMLLECGPDLAQDFLVQLKAELERQAARHPQKSGLSWTSIEVDEGELIRLEPLGYTVGHKGDYLILSDGQPELLWAALGVSRQRSLADTERYQRFALENPSGFLVGSLTELNRAASAGMESDRQKALQELESLGDKSKRYYLESKLSRLETSQFVIRLLGLKQLRSFGFRSRFSEGGGSINYSLLSALIHDEPLTQVTRQIFDGGRSFRLPARGLGDGLSVLWRLGLSDIYRLVVEQLDDDKRQQLSMADGLVKAYTGYDLASLLQLLSGDLYLFTELVEKEIAPADQAGSPNGRVADKKVDDRPDYSPRNMFVLGVVDGQATHKALEGLYSAAQANPMFAKMVVRREYQGQKVFLLGPPSPDGEGEVISEQSVAVALLDEHLAVGGWAEVTRMIRSAKATSSAERDALEQGLLSHSDSSFLLVATHRILNRFEKLIDRASGDPTADELIRDLRQMDLPFDADPAERELREALVQLVQLSRSLSKRMSSFSGPALVIHGRRLENSYQLVFESMLNRR